MSTHPTLPLPINVTKSFSNRFLPTYSDSKSGFVFHASPFGATTSETGWISGSCKKLSQMKIEQKMKEQMRAIQLDVISKLVQSQLLVENNEGSKPLEMCTIDISTATTIPFNTTNEVVDILEPLEDNWSRAGFKARSLATFVSEHAHADY